MLIRAMDELSGVEFVAIARCEQRLQAFGNSKFDAFGVDVWRTSELTWLDHRGKPRRGDLKLTISCDSPYMVESKSLKFYLMSYAMASFHSKASVEESISKDLSDLLGAVCEVQVDSKTVGFEFDHAYIKQSHQLDYIPLSIESFIVDRDLLTPRRNAIQASGRYHTNLFRCLCPMSSQPDYATIVVSFEEAWLSAESLLAYLLSYREHQGFHESTVERIFKDISTVCQPKSISVLGSFARRGGIDISPFRSSRDEPMPNWRSNLC